MEEMEFMMNTAQSPTRDQLFSKTKKPKAESTTYRATNEKKFNLPRSPKGKYITPRIESATAGGIELSSAMSIGSGGVLSSNSHTNIE